MKKFSENTWALKYLYALDLFIEGEDQTFNIWEKQQNSQIYQVCCKFCLIINYLFTVIFTKCVVILRQCSQMGWSFILRRCHQTSGCSLPEEQYHMSYGVPNKIIIDNGSNLNKKTMKELCANFKIEHHNSSPYWPKMNDII